MKNIPYINSVFLEANAKNQLADERRFAMSEILFFNSREKLNEISSKIFETLNIRCFVEGDSTHYLDETYYEGNILGTISIKIAKNNYSYEEYFNHMIIISEDIGARF